MSFLIFLRNCKEILYVDQFDFLGRAYGNLGLTHESLGNFEDAIQYQEQHLSIAAQLNDRVAKTLAYSSLGKEANLLF